MLWKKDSKGRLVHSKVLQLTPDVPAVARTVDASLSTSTEIVLNVVTTILRVYAIGQDIYLKWGADDVDATNFDEIIPVGQIVDLVVPNGYRAINLIERVSGATVVVIEK